MLMRRSGESRRHAMGVCDLNGTRGLVKVLGAATVGPETRKQAFLPGSNGDSSSSSIGRRAESVKDAIGVALRRSQSDGRGDGR